MASQKRSVHGGGVEDDSKRVLARAEQEECIDMSSADSFPASDPPAFTVVTHTGRPKKAPATRKAR